MEGLTYGGNQLPISGDVDDDNGGNLMLDTQKTQPPTRENKEP